MMGPAGSSSVEVRHAASAQPASAVGIPYRHEPAVPVGSIASVLLITLGLLGAMVGALLFAKRFGWLAAWVGANEGSGKSLPFRLLGGLRLSASTRAYVIDCGGSRYVVVESSRQVAIQPQGERGERQDAVPSA